MEKKIVVTHNQVAANKMNNMMNPKLNQLIASLKSQFSEISSERKQDLEKLSQFISSKLKEKELNLIFICVHNSRRSHLSQVWAQISAHHFGYSNVHAYSGGTEETAMYPGVASSLISSGLEVLELSKNSNPVYAIKYASTAHPIIAFSKMYDHSFNPNENFGAVMVCSSADSNCPYISTAAARLLIPFEDPKIYDGTPEELEKYNERSHQIGRELLYVFSKVN